MAVQKARAETLDRLDGSTFDAVVIGGGINGAGVARDAALRGINVCLFEQGDFASGTSSKSTKIAHGGLRYLRNFEFGLVREAQRERRWLRQALPHLVQPLSFCYPVYGGGPDPLWKVRLGVGVYDLLNGRREPHVALTASQTLAANPALSDVGLLGSVRYWDDRMDDARVCLETILSAEEAGAVCLNYVRLTDVQRNAGGFELAYESRLAGETYRGSARSRAIVNTGGPWSDRVLDLIGGGGRPNLAPTKGVHLVVPSVAARDALILDNPRDGRTFFAIPWDDQTLIGTTDTYYWGDPAEVEVEVEDIKYLLQAARTYVPGAALTEGDVAYSFAGLRPLVAPKRRGASEGKISRRHRLLRHPAGVLTLIGGKFTTFRSMAEEAVDALTEALGIGRRQCISATTPYHARIPSQADPRADPELWQWLAGRYGPRAGAAYDVCLSSETLRAPVMEGSPIRLGELVFAARCEHAHRIEDLVERRTHLAWRVGESPQALAAIRSMLLPHLGAWETKVVDANASSIARGGQTTNGDVYATESTDAGGAREECHG
jgi:glycerol-3-phosphate dehydrogenase